MKTWPSLGLALTLVLSCSVMKYPVHRRDRPVPEVSAERLRDHVTVLSERLAPRSFMHKENLERSARYIREHLEKAGARVWVQEYRVEGSTYRNISGTFGPDRGPRVVVGAHYDTVAGTPGADDNASGVAALIELASLLGREPPDASVEVVAYATEEPPFFGTDEMGSAFHARALRAQGVDLRLMIALESVGYFVDEPGSQRYPAPFMCLVYPDRGDFIGVVGQLFDRPAVKRVEAIMREATDLPVHSVNAPSILPGISWSDHKNYWRYGYRAIMVTDTAFYRNHEYHERNDTADRLDYLRMAKVVQGVHEVVRAFAAREPKGPHEPSVPEAGQ